METSDILRNFQLSFIAEFWKMQQMTIGMQIIYNNTNQLYDLEFKNCSVLACVCMFKPRNLS